MPNGKKLADCKDEYVGDTDTVSGYRTIYLVDGQYRRKAFGRLGLRGGSISAY
jgi:hypothetical protein